MAGIFFAFSNFVMKALGRLHPDEGIAAMQSVNVTVLNPGFFLVFFGTGALCVLLLVRALMDWEQPAARYVTAASVLYIAGTLGVTMLLNVPRNNALARAKPGDAEATRLWSDYLVTWTAWNTVRTVAALAAAGLFTFALTLPRT